jgi:hypothetical protein
MPEKVMVCLSTRPGTEKLVRVGARVAGRLATNWYAVYVSRPEDDKGHGDPEAYQRLQEYQRMAKDLGAQVITLHDKNVSRRADSVCAAGEHLACGLWAVGAVAVGYSAARVGFEPLSGRSAGCYGAGGAGTEDGAARLGWTGEEGLTELARADMPEVRSNSLLDSLGEFVLLSLSA